MSRIAGMAVDSVCRREGLSLQPVPPTLCPRPSTAGRTLLKRGLSPSKRGGYKSRHSPDFTDPVFHGNGKDTVIMGFFRPDDPVDIGVLKACRKRGMKVAAIGPATSGRKIPPGETVPGLADAHLGLMCDTYGLFAIEGVDKRVCPTSGLLVNRCSTP